ncbi:MAG: hypothetical protein V5804_00185, partial [Mucilaginibacter sp.]|uniref:hypothetical protein n=1 Tax=Mucilaginibacter sp. TaxID=1882438 RepID=UPI0034E4CDDC
LNNKLELQLAKDENINIENTIRQFKRDCQNIRDFSVTIIEANNIPINTFLFGILEFKNKKKAFFAKNAKEQINFSNILIENIGDKLYINIEDGMSTFSLPRSDQKIQLKPEYQRLHAKMAFNYLAFLYGCDYVSQSYFDPIRAWITYGGEDKFTKHMMNKDSAIQQIIKILPAYAHAILISESNNYIFGHVIIYGHWINLIVLCNNITSNRTNKLAGLICDWRQQKEFSIENLIKEHLIKEASNGTSNASFTT